MNAERVVVAGAGVIGCAIAWRLAQRGVEVIVFDPHQPGEKASWAAAGMLLPFMEPGSPLEPLTHASYDRYPQFVAELRELTGTDAELQLEPRGGSVDNRKLGQALYAAAVAAGAEFQVGIAVRRVITRAGRFHQVELSDGSTAMADAVVVAAGAWSSEILGLPLRVPTIPVKGQMLAVEHATRLLPQIVKGERCYLVPRGEHRTLIGATVERVGFDESVTDDGINQLLMAAYELEPRIADAEITEKWAGLRPGTPDDLPVLGADTRVSGVYYATGHYRNGILLTPITAEIITALLLDGRSEFALDDFRIERFVVDVDDPRCDLCGAPMREWHCRLVCTACGYQRDCSDP